IELKELVSVDPEAVLDRGLPPRLGNRDQFELRRRELGDLCSLFILADKGDEGNSRPELQQVAADQRSAAQRVAHLSLPGNDCRCLGGETERGSVGVDVEDRIADQQHPLSRETIEQLVPIDGHYTLQRHPAGWPEGM